MTGKWKSLILWEPDAHPVRRFGELRRGAPGVSEKVLIQQLREMEEDGHVDRVVYPQVPPIGTRRSAPGIALASRNRTGHSGRVGRANCIRGSDLSNLLAQTQSVDAE